MALKYKYPIFCFDKIYNIKELANLPDFYKNIVFAYAKSNITNKPDTLADVLEQPLWRNKHITVSDKDTRRELTSNFKEWANSNLLHAKDLKFSDGKIDANYIYFGLYYKQ